MKRTIALCVLLLSTYNIQSMRRLNKLSRLPAYRWKFRESSYRDYIPGESIYLKMLLRNDQQKTKRRLTTEIKSLEVKMKKTPFNSDAYQDLSSQHKVKLEQLAHLIHTQEDKQITE